MGSDATLFFNSQFPQGTHDNIVHCVDCNRNPTVVAIAREDVHLCSSKDISIALAGNPFKMFYASLIGLADIG